MNMKEDFPRVSLGISVVLLCLARMLQFFNWSPPSKEISNDYDMVEVFGYNMKGAPLEAIAKPKLKSLLSFYQ